MDSKIATLFSQRSFDIKEPPIGHFERFEKRLQKQKTTRNKSWQWMSVAASVILLIGFGFGKSVQQNTTDLATISPEMKEVQTYFVSTIHYELKKLEKNRSIKTELMIETALDALEELEDGYRSLVKELQKGIQQKEVIDAMIKNYQQRLEILQNVQQQIEQHKNINTLNDEIYI